MLIVVKLLYYRPQLHYSYRCRAWFQTGRSCESQLIITTEDLVKSLNNREQVDVVIVDFSRAFDPAVPHQRLLLKLHHYCSMEFEALYCYGYKTS